MVALDYRGEKGIATALGHAPQAGLANPAYGSVLSVAEALTNIVWAPLADGMDSLSLSANWMWPCRSQEGEDARLYTAVKALSDFCCALQINVPTGKDSLSMTQNTRTEKDYQPGNSYRICRRRSIGYQESCFSGNGKQSEIDLLPH